MRIKNIEVEKKWNRGVISEIFLPKGYPDSVSSDYAIYQFWDSAQALCSSVLGSLSANSLFKGIGVGDESASALSATTNWILRQGCGKIASISFAYSNGSRMGAECKKFRLLADIINDLAMSMNLISPFLPSTLRPYIYAISSICWAIVGIAGSCTRTAMTIHQARADNAADVQAKDQSQETLVELLGLVLGYFTVTLVGENPILVVSVFGLFIVLHLLCNFFAVKCVCQSTLNLTRGRLVIRNYAESGNILSIEDVNKMEPVIFSCYSKKKIIIGAKYENEENLIPFSDKVVIYSGVNILKIFLAENFDNETLFKSVIMTLMLEFNVEADRFQDILEKMKQNNFTFDKHHFVVDNYRVELGQ